MRWLTTTVPINIPRYVLLLLAGGWILTAIAAIGKLAT